MSEYTAIPVEAARDISERFHKSIVIVLAYDPVHGLIHSTSYGVESIDKAAAAAGAEIASKALGGIASLGRTHEDYRLIQANRLLDVVKEALALCGGWREAVVMLEDFCSEPVRLKNMRAAADQIDSFRKNALVTAAQAAMYLDGQR